MSRLRQIARIACLAQRAHQAGSFAILKEHQLQELWGDRVLENRPESFVDRSHSLTKAPQKIGSIAFQGRGFASSPEQGKAPERSVSIDGEKDSLATDLEQATGLEREEVEGRAKGIDIFHEDWLDSPFGTPEAPVQVPSAFTERVVGVPDPDDDSIIWWGAIKEGEAPKQIVEGGEYFVLKRVAGAAHHH